MLQYRTVARAVWDVDGGPGRTKTGQRKQEMTFRTRQSGSELRIEKLNSHPCAQDFDRHLCVSVSYWSLLIHHFVATTDNDLESSFIAARFASGLLVLSSAFAAVESIVKGAQTVQYNFILIATHFLFFFCNMNRK